MADVFPDIIICSGQKNETYVAWNQDQILKTLLEKSFLAWWFLNSSKLIQVQGDTNNFSLPPSSTCVFPAFSWACDRMVTRAGHLPSCTTASVFAGLIFSSPGCDNPQPTVLDTKALSNYVQFKYFITAVNQ